MSDLEKVKESQEEISKAVHLIQKKQDALDAGKIGKSEMASFEEKLKADIEPELEKIRKAAADGLDLYEKTQARIKELQMQSKSIGFDNTAENIAKTELFCMLNGLDNPITGTKWQEIVKRGGGRLQMENPMAGAVVPGNIPINMQLKFLSEQKQKQLFRAIEIDTKEKEATTIEAKGDFISTDVLPGSHYFMLHVMAAGIKRRLYETNPIRPYVSTQSISGDSWGYLEETGDATTTPGLERSAPVKTKIQDAKEFKIHVHTQEVYVPFTQKAARKTGIIDPESYIIEKGTEKINRKWSYLHIIGAGVEEPEGLISRDTGRGGEVPLIYTEVAADLFADFEGFFDVIGKLSQPYRQRTLRWFCNFNTIIKLWKYKDAENRYYISEAAPFRLRGYDIVEFPGLPDVGAGSIPIVFGDLNGYTIVDSDFGYMVRDDITDPKWITIWLVREEGGGITDPYSMVHVKVGLTP